MTVVLRHHEKLELNRVEYRGSVSLAELTAMAEFQAEEPSWLSFDCLNIVMPGADFKAVELAALDAVFARYRELFEPIRFLILRRSAWICQSRAGDAHVEHWIGGRDARTGMSSDVRLFDTIEEAGLWLVLNPAQTTTLATSEDFRDIAHFTIAPEAARPAAL